MQAAGLRAAVVNSPRTDVSRKLKVFRVVCFLSGLRMNGVNTLKWSLKFEAMVKVPVACDNGKDQKWVTNEEASFVLARRSGSGSGGQRQ